MVVPMYAMANTNAATTNVISRNRGAEEKAGEEVADDCDRQPDKGATVPLL